MNAENEKKDAVLYIIATPIGNLEDMTYRAIRVLRECPVLACEDTRLTRKVYSRYEIPLPRIFFSYHEHNEEQAGRKILQLLAEGKNIALCTDAGTPCISDPGYRVIAAALQQGYQVEVIPGASAVTTALPVSGLPPSSFTFKGFPPRKKGPLRKFLEMEKESSHTLIFFESPHRLAALLSEALEIFGNRSAVVCIDLTKLHEEIRRGYLAELVPFFNERKDKNKNKGEITVIIAGNNPKFTSP